MALPIPPPPINLNLSNRETDMSRFSAPSENRFSAASTSTKTIPVYAPFKSSDNKNSWIVWVLVAAVAFLLYKNFRG
jgi:hypothetical protein